MRLRYSNSLQFRGRLPTVFQLTSLRLESCGLAEMGERAVVLAAPLHEAVLAYRPEAIVEQERGSRQGLARRQHEAVDAQLVAAAHNGAEPRIGLLNAVAIAIDTVVAQVGKATAAAADLEGCAVAMVARHQVRDPIALHVEGANQVWRQGEAAGTAADRVVTYVDADVAALHLDAVVPAVAHLVAFDDGILIEGAARIALALAADTVEAADDDVAGDVMPAAAGQRGVALEPDAVAVAALFARQVDTTGDLVIEQLDAATAVAYGDAGRRLVVIFGTVVVLYGHFPNLNVRCHIMYDYRGTRCVTNIYSPYGDLRFRNPDTIFVLAAAIDPDIAATQGCQRDARGIENDLLGIDAGRHQNRVAAPSEADRFVDSLERLAMTRAQDGIVTAAEQHRQRHHANGQQQDLPADHGPDVRQASLR